MISPATILRDAALAGLGLSLAAMAWGGETAGAVAAGAVASLANLFLLMRAASGAGRASDAWVLGRISFKSLVGGLILLVLLRNFTPGPALLGFCSVLLGLSVRAVALLWTGSRTASSEAAC